MPPFGIELISKTDDTHLLFGVEPFDLLDDFVSGHAKVYCEAQPQAICGLPAFTLAPARQAQPPLHRFAERNWRHYFL
ncbi:MAG: hypothetical protein DMF73_19030 [Acidobacteria bacterium]|nr:MAG: hypothetical protein DMF73_19030 [Acidobacteriota bacterium]